MTLIGFLLGLAVGAGMMFYLAGSRAKQQQGGQQQGAQQQGGGQGQRQNQRRTAGTPGFNTEFGTMQDPATGPASPVKPAAISASVFARQGSAENLAQEGNKQAAGDLPTDSTAVESGTVNQPPTVTSTMTTITNDTNPNPALDQSAVEARIPESGIRSSNSTSNRAGSSKGKQTNGKTKR